jgi:hypothetical protein
MKNFLSFALPVAILSTLLISTSTRAGMADRVLYVYSCDNDVGIQMQTAGWVVIRQVDVGQKRVDRMLAIAMMLLATGKPTGFFNEGTPTDWCGVQNAKPITVLGILNQ